MLITTQLLQSNGACKNQIAIFQAIWPNGAEMTAANLSKAVTLGLNVDWLAEKILMTSALVEYKRIRGPEWAEYERKTMPKWVDYNHARVLAWATVLGLELTNLSWVN